MYSIVFENEAKKSLTKIPKTEQIKNIKKIETLVLNPRPEGSIAMKGDHHGFNRIRVGDYRVVYHIEDKKLLVLIVKIGQRGYVYD